tara:strand:- start:259 stop:657 length:399 start_codon:yes stop_codon:yes gene_type:complete
MQKELENRLENVFGKDKSKWMLEFKPCHIRLLDKSELFANLATLDDETYVLMEPVLKSSSPRSNGHYSLIDYIPYTDYSSVLINKKDILMSADLNDHFQDIYKKVLKSISENSDDSDDEVDGEESMSSVTYH